MARYPYCAVAVLLFVFTLAFALPRACGAGAPDISLAGSQWIWFPEGNPAADASFEPRYFRCTFEIPAGAVVHAARLLVAADNTCTAYLNGTEVGNNADFHSVSRLDVAAQLRTGRNVLAIEGRNIFSRADVGHNPAGLICRLLIEFTDGKSQSISTDHSWKVATQAAPNWKSIDFDDAAWSPAKELAAAGGQPWGPVGPTIIIVPDDFPRFIVPGHEEEMDALRRLFWHHYEPAGPLIPLWDEWMPKSTLWPAIGGGARLETMRNRWAVALATRPMNSDGYILTLQHDGLAHAEGWPFPLWTQGGGVGWHFAGTGIPGYDAPTRARPDAWNFTGAAGRDINDKGWPINLTAPEATATTPSFSIEARHAPWLRLNWWAAGMDRANPYIEWTTQDHPDFSADRRVYFSPATPRGDAHPYMPLGGGDGQINTSVGETRTMIPVYRLAGWAGMITRLRIHFDNPGAAQIVIKSFHTAYDSRQTVNNLNFIRGCHDYFVWTADYAFLRSQIPRIRAAMRFMMSEFQTRQRKCVYTIWPGHEGRSGVRYVNGKKTIIPGEGIGSNYWDILPFGGEDALASIYYYDAVLKLADLEEQVRQHPQWAILTGPGAYDPADLRAHAQEVRAYGTQHFWNVTTSRFATVDLDGQMHDYGFTFLNNEAVYFHFATDEQARAIHSWISGSRIVSGDTSTGGDIYHWRFGPRSTTLRNIDYYFWAYSSPESIPFGNQVQDGGAVLGWSFHDLMARLMTAGPDDAAARLKEIADWFDDTQAAGGYRGYYADPSRGTLQGGNVAGGLGLDKEFFESILVPQVMLYGFLGFQPTPEGFSIAPKIPSDWPSLEITRIHLHDQVLNLKASKGRIVVKWTAAVSTGKTLKIEVPRGRWTSTYLDSDGKPEDAATATAIDPSRGAGVDFALAP